MQQHTEVAPDSNKDGQANAAGHQPSDDKPVESGKAIQLAYQLVRFGLVGGLATMVHLGMAWWLLRTWPGLSPFLVNFVAFVFAFQVSFWGHSRFTFRQKGNALKFLAVTLSGFGINNGLLWLFLMAGVHSGFLAICLSVVLVPLFVFVGSRLWVFQK